MKISTYEFVAGDRGGHKHSDYGVWQLLHLLAQPRDIMGEVGGSPGVPTGGSILWEGLVEGS